MDYRNSFCVVRACILSGASLVVTAIASPALAQDAFDSGASQRVEDIVVTAQRREQNLQDVPVAVTAFTERAIDANRIQNVGDIAALAPNTLVRVQPGGNAIPQFTIRGIAAGNSQPGSNNGVALYIDGVYIGRSVGALFDVADLERIEILKGPQGTLFGRNSTGGAVSLTTRNPTGKLGLRADFSVGNYNLRRAKARVDLPEWNGFSAALTYLHLERDGDVKNLGAGTVWDFGPATNGQFGKYKAASSLGGANTDAVQAALRFNSGDFDLNYKFDYTDSYQSAPATAVVAFGPAAAGGSTAATILNSQPGGAMLYAKRPDAVNNWFTSPNHLVAEGHVLTASYKVNDDLTIKNIVSHRTTRQDGINQLDGAGGLVVQPAFSALCGGAACEGSPFLLLGIDSRSSYRQFSEEFQVSYSGKALDLIAGAYYFDDKTAAGGIGIGQTQLLRAIPGFVMEGPLVSRPTYTSHSFALFAQATGHLTETLDLVGGIRHTWDRKGADEPAQAQPFSYRKDTTSWLAGINYRPADHVLLYAKASTGYISGGILNGLAYQPESVITYEGGVKADTVDRRLRTNLAIFASRYKNLQFPTFFNGFNVLDNAGRSKTWGGELETTFVPFDGLTLSGNLGYTHFEYTELDPRIGVVGTYLPNYRPKWTSSLSAEYMLPRFSWGGQLSLRGDTQFHSSYFTTPNPTDASVRRLTTSPETWLFNARVALSDIPLGTGTAQLALWGKNLTNNRSLTFTSPLGLVVSGIYEPARTYGMDLTFRF